MTTQSNKSAFPGTVLIAGVEGWKKWFMCAFVAQLNPKDKTLLIYEDYLCNFRGGFISLLDSV